MKKAKKNRLRRITERTRERRSGRIKDKVHGILSVTANGYGFVHPLETEKNATEVFIPAQFINGAMDGDEVIVGILPPRDEDIANKRGPSGKIIEVVEHGRERVVGELLSGRRVRPLSKHLTEDIDVAGSLNGAKRGDWVELRLLHHQREEGEAVRGAVSRRIGKAGTVQGDLDAVCAEFDLPSPYSEEDDQEALALVPREISRIDYRQATCVTIDPEDAKDFDDAISVATLPDGKWELGVHIADVAAWIAPHSRFDKGALKRSFTAYLPGRTLPMLPKSLTARISMQAHQDSPAHSILFTVDPESCEVLAVRRAHMIVRVDQRLDYDQVQDFLHKDKRPEDCSDDAVEALKVLGKVAAAWRQKRAATEHFLDLDMPEIRVRCDENSDTILGLERKIQRESEELVEEFMLAANVAVANELIERGIGGLFRIHNEPDPLKLEEFSALSEESFGIPTGDLSNRLNACRYLAGLPPGPRRQVLLSHFLRSLPRAVYSEEPSLHYGLGKLRYSHFTSPIRRYPDLLVHQQLWNADLNVRLRSKATMAKFAAETSEREMNNDDAYYSANDRLKLRYLEDKLESDPTANFYEGIVAKVTTNGLLVDIGELGIYGFVPLENLSGSFRRTGKVLNLERGHKRYQVGDFIYLTLDRIDFARGSAIFFSR